MNPAKIPDRIGRIIPYLCALLFFCQGLFGSLEKSLTWDEPVFIFSGYTYLTRNDFRLNREAPPLMQQLEALPLLGLDLTLPDETHPHWANGDHIPFAKLALRQNVEHIRTIALRARLPIILIGACLVLLIAYWAQRLYGTLPALIPALIAAFSPNLLAHAKVATTDLGCAATMFLATFAFWQAIRSGITKHWCYCGIATGIALLTKYTSLLLGPIFLILAAVCLIKLRKDRLRFIGQLSLAAVIAWILVGAGYNLSFNPLDYVDGARRIYSNITPGYQPYLLGKVYDSPLWHYHIIAFLLKVPVSILLLLTLAVVSLFRDPRNREAALYLLLPAILIIGVSCFDKANIGLRRILPALPFLFAFTAQGFSGPKSREPIRAWMVVILLSLTAFEAVRIYPHHLSYFNVLSGGPEQGPYLLDDSNVDWGQDLPALAAWQQKHPEVGPLKVLYFGTATPELYGVKTEVVSGQEIRSPGPGTYAVSAHYLAYFRKVKKDTGFDLDWLTKYQPVGRAGYSIYIYEFPSEREE